MRNILHQMSEKQIPEHQFKRVEEISSFIRNWRINDGLSQSEFAKITETHTNTISNIEKGKNITILTLFACVDAMGLTISQFFEDIE